MKSITDSKSTLSKTSLRWDFHTKSSQSKRHQGILPFFQDELKNNFFRLHVWGQMNHSFTFVTCCQVTGDAHRTRLISFSARVPTKCMLKHLERTQHITVEWNLMDLFPFLLVRQNSCYFKDRLNHLKSSLTFITGSEIIQYFAYGACLYAVGLWFTIASIIHAMLK